MKRRHYLVAAALLTLAFLIAVNLLPDPQAPRFVAGAPATMPVMISSGYDFSDDVPFHGGRVWVWGYDGTNLHQYLYDLESNEILGELFNGSIPQLGNRDGSLALVPGYVSSLRQRAQGMVDFVRKLAHRDKYPVSRSVEMFWALDTTSNSAKRVGDISQISGTSSRWHPSPDFRRGYTAPTTIRRTAFILCDLDQASFSKVETPGEVSGWWDNRHVLVKTASNQFDLFDVVTRSSQSLLGPTEIEAFLNQHRLPDSAGGLTAFANWNGTEYDFYFSTADPISGPGTPPTFLLRANRSSPALELLYRSFEFQWLGKLNSAGTRYVYPGEAGQAGRGGDGSVQLRDLTTGQTRLLVPPDNSRQYSLPNFYGEDVIYCRGNGLYRMELKTGKATALFPADTD